MMDRVAQLIRTAEETRRRIWASLPFHVRFAEFMYRLGAADSAETFGRGMYQLFIEQGVTGMPDIQGRPAAEYLARRRRLPPGYGREYGLTVFGVLMKRHRNQQTVEDIMQGLLEYYYKHKGQIKSGYELKQAESFVTHKAVWKGFDLIKQTKRRRETFDSDLSVRDDEGAVGPGYIDVEPNPVKGLGRASLENVVEHLLAQPDVRLALRLVHPAAEEFVRLSLDGYSDRQIIGDSTEGIDTMLSSTWLPNGGAFHPAAFSKYKKRIGEVLKRAFAELADRYDIAV